jgi:hypothetical protein
MRLTGIMTILVFLLAACGNASSPDNPTSATPTQDPSNPDKSGSVVEFPTVIPNEYSPQSGDTGKTRGNFILDSANLNIMESYPIQVSLYIAGSLPTPCHELRVDVSQPDQQFQIQIEIYTVLDPEIMCAQVLKPIEATIPMGSFPTGSYSVWVNGSKIGEFDS